MSRQTAPPYKLHLKLHLSPGDTLAMTGALVSLHLNYYGQYITSVDTTCPEIWQNNPFVSDVPAHQCHIVVMQYPAIHECGRRQVHFMGAYAEYLSQQIGRPVPLKVNRPHLYLAEDEDKPLDAVKDIGPYIVVNAGHKSDFIAKWAGTQIWQEVADHYRGKVAVVQIGEQNPSHNHPRLDGAIDMVGKTSARELFRLVKFATAAAGPVTFLHHIAGAFEVPYVCVAGGREEQSWEAHPTTIYLHTLGQLDCCKSLACWRSRVVPLKDGDAKDKSLCALPVLQSNGDYIPKCLQVIGSRGITEALDRVLACRGLS